MEGNPYGYTEAVFGDGNLGGNRTDGFPQLQTGDKTLLMTEDIVTLPNTPNDYNRVDAWTDDHASHSNETEFHDETKKITQGGYIVAQNK